MTILELRDVTGLSLSHLLSNYSHFLATIPAIDKANGLVGYHRHDLELSLSKDESNTLFVVVHDNAFVGMALLEHLRRESELFGFGIARISFLCATTLVCDPSTIFTALIGLLADRARSLGVRHLSARLSAHDLSAIHALEEYGFRLMDTVCLYSQDLSRGPLAPSRTAAVVRPYQPGDHSRLLEIMTDVFNETGRVVTRFYADCRFENAKCRNLYTMWFEDLIADGTTTTFVPEVDGQAAGFLCVKSELGMSPFLGTRIGSISLALIGREYRQRGLYSALRQSALNWAAERFEIVLSYYVHVGNPLQHILIKQDAKLRYVAHTLHCWLPKP